MPILLITPKTRADYAELDAQLGGAQALVLAADLPAGRALLGQRAWSLVLVEHDVGEAEVAELVRAAAPRAVVVVAEHPTLAFTLAALRSGARDVVAPPLTAERLRELAAPPVGADAPGADSAASATESLIGQSTAMLDVFRSAARAAESDLPVLIVGETGTGKELLARVIHENSARSAGPRVTVNCAAIPSHLMESELFGHEPGALANTFGRRVGRVQRAHGGTLFLDEVGALPQPLQARLVRMLQTSQIEPIGTETPQAIDVRVIAATHADLDDLVARQRFRSDLYYAMAAIRIEVPPLRERAGDVALLARHILRDLAPGTNRPVPDIDPAALEQLERFSWPGNIRQLRSVLARAVMLANGETLRVSHLPPEVVGGSTRPRAQAAGEFMSLAELERQHIAQALVLTGGHLGQAARLLGIHRNTLRRKLEAYQLPQP